MERQEVGNRKQEVATMRMARKFVGFTALASMLVLAGCRQDMQDQPKFFPQRGTSLFADGRSARPQVENTVARGQLHEDSYFYSGMTGGKEGDGMPFAVTPELMARGQERYNVYCTPCHSRVGNGAGMIVQRGYRPAGNFHTDRLRNAPLGHFFNVMTNGYGAMPDYSAQLTPEDRWAVVAYIRALQLSQDAKPGDASAPAKDIHAIAKDAGMGDELTKWDLPNTAIYGTPNNQDNGIPALTTPGAAEKPATKPAAAMAPMAATQK